MSILPIARSGIGNLIINVAAHFEVGDTLTAMWRNRIYVVLRNERGGAIRNAYLPARAVIWPLHAIDD